MKMPTFFKIFLFMMLLFCKQSNPLFAMHFSATKTFKSNFLVQFCDRPIEKQNVLELKETAAQNLFKLLPELKEFYNYSTQSMQEILLKLVPLLEKYNSLNNIDSFILECYGTTVTNELYKTITEKILTTLSKIKRWKESPSNPRPSNPLLKKTSLLKDYKETIKFYLKTELIRKSLPIEIVQVLKQVKQDVGIRLNFLEKQIIPKMAKKLCSLKLGHEFSQKRQKISKKIAVQKSRKEKV